MSAPRATEERRGRRDEQSNNREQGDSPASQDNGRLKLAEWITFGLSCLVVLSVAGYLLYQALQPEDRLIAPRIEPKLEQVRRDNGRFILPVQVTNDGKRTLRDMKLEATWQLPDGQEEAIDFTIDYLGEKSSKIVYFYFAHDPRGLNVQVEPLHYRLE